MDTKAGIRYKQGKRNKYSHEQIVFTILDKKKIEAKLIVEIIDCAKIHLTFFVQQ
jgi:hypothetical protein